MASESPILSQPEPNATYDQNDLIYQQEEDLDNVGDAIPQLLKLNLRGTRIDMDRDSLINLPESLLIAMFPHGIVLGRQDNGFVDDDEHDGQSPDSVGQDELIYVDIDPGCLNHVQQFYQQACKSHALYMAQPQRQQQLLTAAATSPMLYPLLNKAPIIVLREELEYYCIPQQRGSDMTALKLACGQYLKQHGQVFEALQKNIDRDNNVAEQHLIDMLCDAGFKRNHQWGHRELEPTKTCVISMSLVLLNMGGAGNNMAAAQKLMLFWRKPARKCWWDGNTVEIQGQTVRLWARRTWTLELVLV